MKLKEYLTNLFNTRAVANADGQKTLTLEEIVNADDFIDGGLDLLDVPEPNPDEVSPDPTQALVTLEVLDSYATKIDLVDILNRLANLEKLIQAVDTVSGEADNANVEIW